MAVPRGYWTTTSVVGELRLSGMTTSTQARRYRNPRQFTGSYQPGDGVVFPSRSGEPDFVYGPLWVRSAGIG
jgi:hypothetical protein